VGRAIQAFGTATGMVVARAIVVDRYPIERMVRMLASLTMVAVLGNSLAPVLGGFLATGLGWRSVFGVLMFAATVVGLIVWRRLPETRPADARPAHAREMASVAWALLRMPMFTGALLQGAAVYATFLVLLSLTPYVMISALGRPPTEFGLYYLLIAGGYFLGNWSVRRLTAHHDLHWMVLVGVSLTVVGAVIALAFMALGLMHPLWLFLPMAVLSYGQGLALPNVTATAVSLAPQHAGVASSTVGFLQQLIGAAAVQWMGHFPTDTALPMLTFCVVVCVLALGMLYVFPRVEAGRRAS
jgi:DHA1 family bicyclomycin/chloramphenicol resistance-like MFS transporter